MPIKKDSKSTEKDNKKKTPAKKEKSGEKKNTSTEKKETSKDAAKQIKTSKTKKVSTATAEPKEKKTKTKKTQDGNKVAKTNKTQKTDKPDKTKKSAKAEKTTTAQIPENYQDDKSTQSETPSVEKKKPPISTQENKSEIQARHKDEKETVKSVQTDIAQNIPEPEPVPEPKEPQKTPEKPIPTIIGTIEINELITVRDLASKMNVSVGELLKKLLSMGSLATINQRLDTDIAILLASEFMYEAKLISIYSEEENTNKKEDESKLKSRPPIVTIMGHVDHGKTSLLDAIRKTNIAQGEYGGITQHIGAYRVKTSDGRFITFLDTPGHEAFTAMRSRGAQITDIVILVVSAADGIMPQTIEAINHAKDANVPIIVAVNKIDLPTADPQKVKQELNQYGLLAEEWGGDVIMVEISAKKNINIDLLLENIQIKADMMEIKANPERAAEGIVIEAKLDSKKGTLVTLLVEKGVLRVGDNIVVGTTYGKIRAMSDEYGKRFNEAFPSTPAEVLGINNPPQAGDKFITVDSEQQARQIAESRFQKAKTASLTGKRHLSLADISAGKTKDLRIILKADVQGSLEAVCDELERMSTNEINLKIVHRGAGAITASDVDLAIASDALIVGFNLRPDPAVEKFAEDAGVSIQIYRIIYELTADVKAAMEGLLDPDLKEKILGRASVKQVFKLSSSGTISGCLVTEGKIQRAAKARLLRDNAIIFEGNISSLKRFKDDTKEVDKGFECGIGLENFSDIKTGDVVECFALEKTARKL
ncbi:MAG: translation initiation factor IF-2 [Elusimicrobiota bacterium]|jgi:translation initiation factor IF-2|nr:translation initiation factor IF-2 [Elusimicrobiota bacterium]